MSECHALRMWGSDDGHSAVLRGEHRGSQGKPFVQAFVALVKLVVDSVACCGRQVSLVEEVVDEIAIALFGGHTSSGGVGLAQVAQLGKCVEFRAHGS